MLLFLNPLHISKMSPFGYVQEFLLRRGTKKMINRDYADNEKSALGLIKSFYLDMDLVDEAVESEKITQSTFVDTAHHV